MTEAHDVKVIRYTLQLQSPVLVTDVQGEPNSSVSLPYITGSLLRGAVIAQYLGDHQEFEALDEEARGLFLSDTTRYLNAYPINTDGNRALPTPVAWRYNKMELPGSNDARRIYNLSWAWPEDVQEESVDDVFVWIEGETAWRFSPPRQLNVHTQRDARKGRATEEKGAIYRYDALAAGLRLQAVILTQAYLTSKLEGLLRHATLWLGRARRAGYGEVRVTEVETLDYWRESETEDSPGAIEAGEQLQIILTSDALLRDYHGQPTLDPRDTLVVSLGLTTEALIPLPAYSWAATRLVGGFNRKWGLPLPQTIALAAGSVFTYQTSVAIPADTLDQLEWLGVGERRNEGFGRLLINWQEARQGEFESEHVKRLFEGPQLEALSSEEEQMARTIARRLLRHHLDADLRRKINFTRVEFPPHKNQLSRLRVVLRAIQSGRKPDEKADVERLQGYLQELQKRRSVREQFARAKVGDKDLLQWVDDQIDRATDHWLMEPVQLGAGEVMVTTAVDELLAQEYALRLIDQVLYRATKQARS